MFYSFVLSANQTNCEGKKTCLLDKIDFLMIFQFFSLGMEKYQTFFKANLS